VTTAVVGEKLNKCNIW